MKTKTLVFGSFLAIFLLLMMPNVNSIKFNQVKEIQEKSYADILTDDLSMKSGLALLKGFDNNEWTCDDLHLLYVYMALILIFTMGFGALFVFPVVLLVWAQNKAIEMDCDWVKFPPYNSLNTDSLCSSCNK